MNFFLEPCFLGLLPPSYFLSEHAFDENAGFQEVTIIMKNSESVKAAEIEKRNAEIQNTIKGIKPQIFKDTPAYKLRFKKNESLVNFMQHATTPESMTAWMSKNRKGLKAIGGGLSGNCYLLPPPVVVKEGKSTEGISNLVIKEGKATEEGSMLNEFNILRALSNKDYATQLLAVFKTHEKTKTGFQQNLNLILPRRGMDLHKAINKKLPKTDPTISCPERSNSELYDEKNYLTTFLLEAIHSMRKDHLVHGDIKPQNIVVGSRGFDNPAFIDFGGSFFDGEKSCQSVITYGYISPERLFKSTVYSNTIDCFSMGAVIFNMFSTNPNYVSPVLKKMKTDLDKKERKEAAIFGTFQCYGRDLLLSEKLIGPDQFTEMPMKGKFQKILDHCKIPRNIQQVILDLMAPNPVKRYKLLKTTLQNFLQTIDLNAINERLKKTSKNVESLLTSNKSDLTDRDAIRWSPERLEEVLDSGQNTTSAATAAGSATSAVGSDPSAVGSDPSAVGRDPSGDHIYDIPAPVKSTFEKDPNQSKKTLQIAFSIWGFCLLWLVMAKKDFVRLFS